MAQHQKIIIVGGGCFGISAAFKFTPVLGKLIADVLERKPNKLAKKFAWRTRGELTTEDARYLGS